MVVRWASSLSTEKTLITKEKEEKMGQINTMKTNIKRRKDLRLPTWNVRSLYSSAGLHITINELRKYKIAIAAIQETRWKKLTPLAFTRIGYNINTSIFVNNQEFEVKPHGLRLYTNH
jgi:hypothetical protein